MAIDKYIIKDFLKDMKARNSEFNASAFAEKCGYNDSTGRKWANGKSHPYSNTLEKIGEVVSDYYSSDFDLYKKMLNYYEWVKCKEKYKVKEIITVADTDDIREDGTYIDEDGETAIALQMQRTDIKYESYDLMNTHIFSKSTFRVLIEDNEQQGVWRGFIYKTDKPDGMISLCGNIPKNIEGYTKDKFLNSMLSFAFSYLSELYEYGLIEKPLVESYDEYMYQHYLNEVATFDEDDKKD